MQIFKYYYHNIPDLVTSLTNVVCQKLCSQLWHPYFTWLSAGNNKVQPPSNMNRLDMLSHTVRMEWNFKEECYSILGSNITFCDLKFKLRRLELLMNKSTTWMTGNILFWETSPVTFGMTLNKWMILQMDQLENPWRHSIVKQCYTSYEFSNKMIGNIP